MFAFALLATLAPVSVASQEADTTTAPVYRLDALEVTATRTSREIFRTPAAVSVVGSAFLETRQASGVADALRTLPGLDVTGVGLQQPRPIIRGLRGQRILLLQDGLRLNNARRQQDFGEVPSIVDLGAVERIEVVRGPSSVLYGSDAIGGVINVITSRRPPSRFGGGLSYEYAGGFDASTVRGRVHGGSGALSLEAGGHWRTGSAYSAPAGRFGEIELATSTPVLGTGIDDWSLGGRAVWAAADHHDLSIAAETYRADDAAFGLVEPEAYASGMPRIDIRYPEQSFSRVTLGYDGDFRRGPVDHLTVRGYLQENTRGLSFDFVQGFGPEAPPGASLQIANRNHTDLSTVGLRAEARSLAGSVLWTYGIDAFRDRSENADTSVTTVVGFGPPSEERSTRPRVPNARYHGIGAFLQGEREFGRLTVIAGGRLQSTGAETRPTADLDATEIDRSATSVVGALNGLLRVSDEWTLIGSVGRGFRAPNLVEWFFEGPVPEARAFQVSNPDLDPETSVSIDAGVRFRNARVAAEAFVFQNTVRNGIRSQATGDSIQGFAAFESVNLDELRFRGAEVAAQVEIAGGLRVDGSWTHLSSEDVLDPDNPTGETFSNRWVGGLHWEQSAGRLWATWGIRHNGERRDADLARNPLGEILPAFTVHHLRAGIRADAASRIPAGVSIGVENLGDALYAEFANASFFRPEPGRRVVLRAEVAF